MSLKYKLYIQLETDQFETFFEKIVDLYDLVPDYVIERHKLMDEIIELMKDNIRIENDE